MTVPIVTEPIPPGVTNHSNPTWSAWYDKHYVPLFWADTDNPIWREWYGKHFLISAPVMSRRKSIATAAIKKQPFFGVSK